MSPESTFILNSDSQAGHRHISKHAVGLWLAKKPEDIPEEDVLSGNRVDFVSAEVLSGFLGQTTLLSALRPAMRSECIATMPPEYEFGILSDIFNTKIDPLFPLLKDEPWDKHGIMEMTALRQCVCLIASLDPASRPHLRLPHTDLILSQPDFRARVHAAVKQSLDLGFITDTVALMQICAMMSMCVQKQEFGELSTFYCTQAVLHEQTLGFHVGWPEGKAGGERACRLFWCIWVLDRLNAATNGRPTLIHSRDMDRKVIDSVEDQPSSFKLLIRITEFLDDTISLYRPHAAIQEQTENTSHTFEGLVEATGAHDLSNGLLGTFKPPHLHAQSQIG